MEKHGITMMQCDARRWRGLLDAEVEAVGGAEDFFGGERCREGDVGV